MAPPDDSTTVNAPVAMIEVPVEPIDVNRFFAKTEEEKLAAARATAASVIADRAKAAAARVEKAQHAKSMNPAVATPPATVPAPSRLQTGSMMLAAAGVLGLMAAIGVTQAGWLDPKTAQEEQSVQQGPSAQPMAVSDNATTVPHDNVTTPERQATPPATTKPPRAVVSAAPARPSAANAPSATSQISRVSAAPSRSNAPVPVAVAPTGRFFERTDVDVSPEVATRIEPHLPVNRPHQPGTDIVVVRVLVSQTGHPFRISLLRKSKSGRSSDDAVVAAVTQWTFSPARKRGEAVNCWYNIGVPLTQAD